MQKPMLTRGVVVMIALMAAWVGGWVTPVAGAKKPPPPPAPVPQTGQTQCWDGPNTPIECGGTGQDGEFQTGVRAPLPRFTDRGNGTVRDNLTGLIWLKDASCGGSRTWADALAAVADLNAGVDFSCADYAAGTFADWRLLNVKELQSLMHFGFVNPTLSNAAGTAQWTEGNAFSGVQSSSCWSSTSDAGNQGLVWNVALYGTSNTRDDVCSIHGTVLAAEVPLALR